MKTWLISLWDSFRSSYWFVPSLLTLGAAVLALVLPELDQWAQQAPRSVPDWLTTTPESARLSLSSIAAAIVTMASVVFSITVVALSLTAQQYGSRLLRTFMEDAGTQWSLGTFVATSLYALLVLRRIRGEDGLSFVPHLSVAVGTVLTIISLGVLIYFIHHMAASIQANHIVQAVARDLDQAIERVFPERREPQKAAEDHVPEGGLSSAPRPGGASGEVASRHEGYLLGVDEGELVSFACREDLVIELLVRPGNFVCRDSALARVWPQEKVNEESSQAVNSAFVTGPRRTPRQDVECAVLELVEVAVRALSPGINDPLTAMACIDRLEAALRRLAQREPRPAARHDGDGRLRVIVPQVRFPEVLDTAYNLIRQNARDSAAVSMRLLEALAGVVQAAFRSEDLQAVRRQAEMISSGCRQSVPEENDRRALEARFEQLLENIAPENGAMDLPPEQETEPREEDRIRRSK